MHLFIVTSLLLVVACRATQHRQVFVHYLGHAAFLLRFDNGIEVVTDYGESHAYGLDSPIYSLGNARPEIATVSHDHADHAGGALPTGVEQVLTGERGIERDGLAITAIRTHENSIEEPDNTSYLFEYGGKKILHLGDCQALITGHDDPAIRAIISRLYPDTYDLVFVPIGFVRDILPDAAGFIRLLDARRVVPIHYWTPEDRDSYLRLLDSGLDSRGRRYRTEARLGPLLVLREDEPDESSVEVVGLTPGPYDRVYDGEDQGV